MKARFLPLFVAVLFFKSGNIPGKRLAKIMEQAHKPHLFHIEFGKLILAEPGHQAQAERVLRYAFVPAGGREGMAGMVFHGFGYVKQG